MIAILINICFLIIFSSNINIKQYLIQTNINSCGIISAPWSLSLENKAKIKIIFIKGIFLFLFFLYSNNYQHKI